MINNEIKEKIIQIMKEENIPYAGIFGSYAKGTETKESDIDVLIDLGEEKNKTLFKLGGIQYKLEKSLGKKVDVVPIDSIYPKLKENILNSVITIHGIERQR
jgi:predicted nucleotidyltransferase